MSSDGEKFVNYEWYIFRFHEAIHNPYVLSDSVAEMWVL